jgi:NTE family protein
MVVHGLSIMLARHLMTEVARLRGHAHLVVLPPPCPQLVQPIDFSRAAELMEAGERAAHRHLDAVANGDVDPAALVVPPLVEAMPP